MDARLCLESHSGFRIPRFKDSQMARFHTHLTWWPREWMCKICEWVAGMKQWNAGSVTFGTIVWTVRVVRRGQGTVMALQHVQPPEFQRTWLYKAHGTRIRLTALLTHACCLGKESFSKKINVCSEQTSTRPHFTLLKAMSLQKVHRFDMKRTVGNSLNPKQGSTDGLRDATADLFNRNTSVELSWFNDLCQ